MNARIVAAIQGDLRKHMAAEIKGAETAVMTAIRRAGSGLKADWRGQIIAGGLGPRLARTIRDLYYPRRGESVSAAALVYSRASKIVDAFDRGVTVRSAKGFWLAIPTELAGKGLRGGRITPGEWERRTGVRLRFVYRRGQSALLIADDARINKRGRAVRAQRKADQGRLSAIIFFLVPFVRLKKRLDLDRATREWQAKLPGLIVRNWPDIEAD